MFTNSAVAGQCNYGRMVSSVIFGDEDDYDPNNVQGAAVTLTYIDINGAVVKRCSYQQLSIVGGVPSLVTGGNTIPNCNEDATYQT